MCRRTSAAAAVAALVALTACSTSPPGHRSSAAGPGSTGSSSGDRSSTGPSHPPGTAPAPRGPTLPARRTTTLPDRKARAELAVPGVPEPKLQLPRGGRTILGSYRLVAYYGGPDGRALGALGDASPEHMAQVITKRAAQYTGYGRTIQPAMELIASIAQGGPGADHLYSRTVSPAAVQRYLTVAHRHRMLLILDFQPGRGDFLPQVRKFARFIADPSVSVALDPEWMMHGQQVPGRVIGWSSAASINRVQAFVSDLVKKDALPDKLLMVHQFTVGMLPDRNRIRRYPGLELTYHADGFGSRAQKLATYRRLAFPGRPDGAGFKLFLTQDTGLMTPAQVMALSPRPDVITYQ